jgi:hypothetical protein
MQTELAAIAVSVLAEGRIGRLIAGGALSTKGDGVTTLDVEGRWMRSRFAARLVRTALDPMPSGSPAR